MNMNDMKNTVLIVLSVCGSGIAWALGGWDSAMQALILFLVIDWISGLMVAGVFRRSGKSESGALDSQAGYKGIMKKVGILFAVLIGVQLDRVLNIDLARNAIVIFFIGNEGLSIVENLGLMGIPFPDKIKQMLEQLKSKDEIKS